MRFQSIANPNSMTLRSPCRPCLIGLVVLCLAMVVPVAAQTEGPVDDTVITISDPSAATAEEMIQMIEAATSADTGFDDLIEVPSEAMFETTEDPLSIMETDLSTSPPLDSTSWSTSDFVIGETASNAAHDNQPTTTADTTTTGTPTVVSDAASVGESIPAPYPYISTVNDLFDRITKAGRFTILDADQQPPAWVKDSAIGRRINGVYEVSFTVGPYVDTEECKVEMFLTLQDKIDSIARSIFDIRSTKAIRPTTEMLMQAVSKCVLQRGEFSPGPMYQLHVLLQIDEETERMLKKNVADAVRRERIGGMIGLFAILFIILCVVKLGMRKTRLRNPPK